MATKITIDSLESYLYCKYKGYLKSTCHQGTQSDYKKLLYARRDEVKLNIIKKILARDKNIQIARDLRLSTSLLKQGLPFILEATLEDDIYSISFDGLKRVQGKSILGDFHYIPMLSYARRRIHKEQRLLLELLGVLISQIQGAMPNSGIIWHGKECKPTVIRLNPDQRMIGQFIQNLRDLFTNESPPKLILNSHCQMCEFRQRCQDQAVQEDNISLIRGISEKEIKKNAKKGIFTATQLAFTFRPRRKGKNSEHTSSGHSYPLKALAIRDKRIYIFGAPELPDQPVCFYLDVENDPETDFVYLIGLIVSENGAEKALYYWADDKDQEAKIFENFVSEVTKHDNFLVFCYGSLERAFIKRMRAVAKKKKLVDKILNALVNILSLIYSHLYFPTYSNGLKDIGGYLGSSWTDPNASGLQSIVWRMRWEATQEDEWKQKLTVYNLEDCAALKKLTEVIRTIIKSTSDNALIENDQSPLPISNVKDVEKLSDFHTWGRVNYFHADYEYINKCAYFDYQRERVYIRNSKTIRKHGKHKASPNRKLKGTKKIEIVASKCPSCMSKKVKSGIKKEVRSQEPRVKRAFDLVMTPSAIRRIIIDVRTSVHKCQVCSEEFIPYQYQRLDKHFHSLKSWAMFQHVEYRLSLKMIEKMFFEYFGIRVFWPEIHMFKSLFARYYKRTYQSLLNKILSGNLLHVDETEVKLQNGKGYVWVFTNLEEVIFMFKPSREGDFLRDLLKGFHGVLISDFYTAYDSIPCPQQKCLIHLMRDINQELLNNPFDEELQSITHPFGILLRRIIETVDQHGLKREYLKKHDSEVKVFFESLVNQSFRSEAAESLRSRLVKYKDKLFTFIHHNGVPWNNNNAEHAIKQFAYYREMVNGMITETGISDFLLLLSICQTCKYKNQSFLKFLISQQRDVDAFCGRTRHRRSLPPIELYPKGFVPPHLAYRLNSDQNDKNRSSML